MRTVKLEFSCFLPALLEPLRTFGEILAEKEECNAEIIATLEREELESYRKQIQCYTDRRPEVYGTLPRGARG